MATSGEEEGKLGAENLLKRMSDTEKKNTLLVINLDNLIVGDKLYFNSGVNTPEAVRKLTRDRALAIARSHGIAATTNPGLNKTIRKAPGVVMTQKYSTKPVLLYFRWKRLTGILAIRMVISNAQKQPHSLQEIAGMT